MMLQQTIVNRQAVEVLRQRVEKQWQRQSSSPKKSKRQQKELKKVPHQSKSTGAVATEERDHHA
ncbi:hypothetical protein FC96_GL000662 [Secundilactobacillus kimchicus JCM 15530]|uniref:Uncharacterized protein n=2 Tax=Secundilactobacillus kimchicus TaxID=528209 RepID=A0A0R1HUU9_9LACO|nr:hypothetical protein FC96_GL000662 [Secundilactobacillus kimchicus JCM 15530]